MTTQTAPGADGPAASGTAPLLVQQRDRARWLVLNRPERRNALSPLLTGSSREPSRTQ